MYEMIVTSSVKNSALLVSDQLAGNGVQYFFLTKYIQKNGLKTGPNKIF